MQTIINTFYKAFSQKRRQVLPQYRMWELFLPHPVLGGKEALCTDVDGRVTGLGRSSTSRFPPTPKLGISLGANLSRPHLGGENDSTPPRL